MGIVAHLQGDLASARSLQQESLAIFWELENTGDIVDSLETFASLNVQEGKPEQAARLWGTAQRLREEICAPLPPNEREEYDHQVAMARQALGEETFTAAWAEGRAMTLEQTMEYALEEGKENSVFQTY
jgi:hypothetical protein